MVVIVDYGMGNLQSILTKVERLKHSALVSSNPQDIMAASKIILPGVGNFAAGMANIQQRNLQEVLNKKVLEDKAPVLGICLGMQLLTCFSEEGHVDGLKWIDARTEKFNFPGTASGSTAKLTFRIPHVGWNKVFQKKASVLFKGIADGQRFYFTHSYKACCKDAGDIAAATDYGGEFTSVIERGNIFGVQFHPEKSHDHGLALIDNFLTYA